MACRAHLQLWNLHILASTFRGMHDWHLFCSSLAPPAVLFPFVLLSKRRSAELWPISNVNCSCI